MLQLGSREPVPRDGQHLRTYVYADCALHARPEQLQHTPRARPGIQQSFDRVIRTQTKDRAFDLFVRGMQAANTLPLRGIRAEIGCGFRGPRGADRGQASKIGFERRRGPVGQRAQRVAELPRQLARGSAVENPASFLRPFKQARIAKQLQVARHARLALTENLGEFGHGQFRLGQQRQQAQAGQIARRAQYRHQAFHLEDITISLYGYASLFRGIK